MNSLLLAVLVTAVVLMAIGFWCGWFVRGGTVKKLREERNKLLQHAIDAGWVVSEKELLENLAKHGIYLPKIPLTFSTAKSEEEGLTND